MLWLTTSYAPAAQKHLPRDANLLHGLLLKSFSASPIQESVLVALLDAFYYSGVLSTWFLLKLFPRTHRFQKISKGRQVTRAFCISNQQVSKTWIQLSMRCQIFGAFSDFCLNITRHNSHIDAENPIWGCNQWIESLKLPTKIYSCHWKFIQYHWADI